jgi:tRNA/rRNA methyltransferase
MKIYLIFIGLTGGVNLGLIVRLMENFEADEIRLVNPVLTDEDIKDAWIYSARARKNLDTKVKIYEDFETAIEDMDIAFATSAVASPSGENILRTSLNPKEAAELVIKGGYKRVAIVFGREATGLTVDEIRKCDGLINIESSSKYRALNIANSVAIILYEFFRTKKVSEKKEEKEHLTRDLIIRTVKYLEDSMMLLTKNEDYSYKVSRALYNILVRGVPKMKEIKLLISGMRKIYLALSKKLVG